MARDEKYDDGFDFADKIRVRTRNGAEEDLDIDKITGRIRYIAEQQPPIKINVSYLVGRVCRSLGDNMTTAEIDDTIARIAADVSLYAPEYGTFAARLAIDNFHRSTLNNFLDKTKMLYSPAHHSANRKYRPMVTKEYCNYVELHHEQLSAMIDYKRDFMFDYFGFSTFKKLYSLGQTMVTTDGKEITKLIERPQDMFMRVAIALHRGTSVSSNDIESEMKAIKDTYEALSLHRYTHASPTYFNAATPSGQLASCYLFGIDDTTESINEVNGDIAKISKNGGGIGIHQHALRSTGSPIRSSNGVSSGIVPFNRMFAMTVLAFNQKGKRNGSVAVYLMPHHPDIMEFLALKLPDGVPEMRARELFYGLWIPDIFMERLIADGIWSLFDPDATEDLSNYTGKEYRQRYLTLESKKLYKKQISARDLWKLVCAAQRTTGMPYICYADTVNALSNQKNLGVIKSSNLCTEIMLISNAEETAVCNLCSIGLATFVRDRADPPNHKFPSNPYFDFDSLISMTRLCVRNLNRVIDSMKYHVEKSRISNLMHRPIGIGVQGLANVFCKMRYAFDSAEALELNNVIFETIYYAAMLESANICRREYIRLKEIAKRDGFVQVTQFSCEYKTDIRHIYTDEDLPTDVYAYPSMKINGGAPISKGIFHFEMYVTHDAKMLSRSADDWESLREMIKLYGVRNSQLIALMPTASTSQLLGNNECFEPFTHNVYARNTLAGLYYVINEYLVNDLMRFGLWSKDMASAIMMQNGSIQDIGIIPKEIRELYKTAFEIDQKFILKQAIDRQRFVDQAQSLNLYYKTFSSREFTRNMIDAWSYNLKTGKYYAHTEAGAEPIKFSIPPSLAQKIRENFRIEDKKEFSKAVKSTEPATPTANGTSKEKQDAFPIAEFDSFYETARPVMNFVDKSDVCVACSS